MQTAPAPRPIASGSVNFKIKNAGFWADGNFAGLQGSIAFDPQQPGAGKITATVDATTIDTGMGMRDKHLRSDDYFDVAQHPEIRMESTSIKKRGPNRYTGTFNLTIRGVTKQVEVPFTVRQQNGQQVFSGEFTINRRNFEVGGGSLLLSDQATVSIKAVVEER